MPTEKSVMTVSEFIQSNSEGDRPRNTQITYRRALSDFTQFMGFDDDQLFLYARDTNNQPSKDLQEYQTARIKEKKNKSSVKLFTRVVRSFLSQNEWTLKKQTKTKPSEPIKDEALTLELLQGMMSVGTVHQRAMLETMISTGCRIGELAAVRLSDLNLKADPAELQIPGEFTKNGKRAMCYLTIEAKRYMMIWLAGRDHYLERTALKAKNFRTGDRDEKLFACSKALFTKTFRHLIESATGKEQENINPLSNGRKQAIRYPLHCASTRKYFYSKMLPVCGEIVTNGLMNHASGYLESSYGRIPVAERREMFKKNEHVLFIIDNTQVIKDLEKQGAVILAQQQEIEQLKKSQKEIWETFQYFKINTQAGRDGTVERK
jgi:site-specific recombinase XerD